MMMMMMMGLAGSDRTRAVQTLFNDWEGWMLRLGEVMDEAQCKVDGYQEPCI
jgi:hypothetical protein